MKVLEALNVYHSLKVLIKSTGPLQLTLKIRCLYKVFDELMIILEERRSEKFKEYSKGKDVIPKNKQKVFKADMAGVSEENIELEFTKLTIKELKEGGVSISAEDLINLEPVLEGLDE